MALVRLHHVALRTRRLPPLEAFYAGVLGLPVLRRDGERSVWLGLGEGAVLMLERAEAAEPDVPAGTMEMIALAIEPGGHGAWREKLAAAGVAIEAASLHTLYLRDPDGRRVGLSDYAF